MVLADFKRGEGEKKLGKITHRLSDGTVNLTVSSWQRWFGWEKGGGGEGEKNVRDNGRTGKQGKSGNQELNSHWETRREEGDQRKRKKGAKKGGAGGAKEGFPSPYEYRHEY